MGIEETLKKKILHQVFKAKTLEEIDRARALLEILEQHGLKGEAANQFFLGAHFRIKDNGTLFQELSAVEGAQPRFSSHFKPYRTKELGVSAGRILPEVLFLETVQDGIRYSHFQSEASPWRQTPDGGWRNWIPNLDTLHTMEHVYDSFIYFIAKVIALAFGRVVYNRSNYGWSPYADNNPITSFDKIPLPKVEPVEELRALLCIDEVEIEETTKMLKYLNKAHKLDHPSIDNSEATRLIAFTDKNYQLLSKGNALPSEVQHAESKLFSRYSYHLVCYRACLVDAAQYKDGDYLSYINTDNIYSRTLAEGNPFLLKEHFNQLSKIINDVKTQDLPLNKKVEFMQTVQQFNEYYIPSLSPDHFAGFKAMLLGYSYLLLADSMEQLLPGDRQDPDLINELYVQAEGALQLALEIQKQQQDSSLSLYEDPQLFSSYGFASMEEVLSKIDDKINCDRPMP